MAGSSARPPKPWQSHGKAACRVASVSVDRSTIWPYRDGEPGEFYYQRYAHPTGVEAERRLGELDGGHALLFASGAGATTALALAFLAPGRTIALAAGAYFGTGARRGRSRLARGALQPLSDDARPRSGDRAPRACGRRRDGRDADPPPPARTRGRLRAPQCDEVPRRPRRRAARRGGLPA